MDTEYTRSLAKLLRDSAYELDRCARFIESMKPPVIDGTPIESIAWSARVRKAFIRGGIYTVEQLCGKTQDDILCLKNIGFSAAQEINERLASVGKALKGQP